MNNLEQYNHILINSFIKNQKQKEILNKKTDLINQVYDYYEFRPTSQLFLGFNPAILNTDSIKSYIYGVTQNDFYQLEKVGCRAKRIENFAELPDKVDAVISGDEFFTFCVDETVQRKFLSDLRDVVKKICITTLRDYKNQDFKDKEFSFPVIIRDQQSFLIYLESHEHDLNIKNTWETTVYAFNKQQHFVYGPFPRKAVYFKQLAKFSADAGFQNFVVHKNLMYKSIIRKNYEHVISFS